MSISLHDELLTIASAAADHLKEIAMKDRQIRLLKAQLHIAQQTISELQQDLLMARKGVEPLPITGSRG